MTVIEIRFVVTGPQDGKPNGWDYLGVRFTPAQWASYIADDTQTPAGWGSRVGPDKKRAYKRLRGQIISGTEVLTDGTKTEEQMREEVYGPAGDFTQDEIDVQLATNLEVMTQALATNTAIAVNGEDTNWGIGDLKAFGVLLADLSHTETDQIFVRKLKQQHALLPRDGEGPRSERVLYESPVFPPPKVARWRDATDYVAVDRDMTPFLFADTSWHEVV